MLISLRLGPKTERKEEMAGNHYHRFCTSWDQHLHRGELFPQNILTVSPMQQMLYHNMHMQELHQNLGLYIKQESQSDTVTKSFSNSTSSSPLSSVSLEESPDCISTTPAKAHEAADRLHCIRSMSPFSIPTGNNYPQLPTSTDLSDGPIDLTKPKLSGNAMSSDFSSSSRLVNLLSRKRGCESDNNHEQSGPLNLSKKVCSVSRPWNAMLQNPLTIGNVIDMKDAIDNPVQLVRLLNETHVAQQVTQFLSRMMERIFAMQQFHNIQEGDRISLVLNCWHRLILWVYAENKFTFQVTSLCHNSVEGESASQHVQPPRLNQPTMAFVKSIATFIKKYETLQIDSEELRLLFAITLFHSTENESYADVEKIAQHRKAWMKQLQSYTMRSEQGAKRYSDLLLYLPMLYGVNGKMVEELFCQHISANANIRTILAETIRGFQYT